MGWLIFWSIVIITGVCFYRADPKGWQATTKRVTTFIRAHIESSKPIKKIEQQNEQKALDDWQTKFDGKDIDAEPNHVIVETWFAKPPYMDEIRPYFKCKCGYENWHLDIEMATRKANDHVREQNAAKENLKKNGGTHAW